MSDLSACITYVNLNGNRIVPFSVDLQHEMGLTALKFCRKWDIAPSDCDTIVRNHEQKCFSSISQPNDPSKGETFREQPLSKASPREHSSGVDYSAPVGKPLQVTIADKGETYKLQRFQGETEEMMLTRFCKMVKLGPEVCHEVHRNYELEQQKGDVSDHKASNSISDSSNTGTERLGGRGIFDRLENFIGVSLWQATVFIVTIVYLILERQQNAIAAREFEDG